MPADRAARATHCRSAQWVLALERSASRRPSRRRGATSGGCPSRWCRSCRGWRGATAARSRRSSVLSMPPLRAADTAGQLRLLAPAASAAGRRSASNLRRAVPMLRSRAARATGREAKPPWLPHRCRCPSPHPSGGSPRDGHSSLGVHRVVASGAAAHGSRQPGRPWAWAASPAPI